MRPLFIALFPIALCLPAATADWPQFLGPNRNGFTPETNLASQWPKEGPRSVWQKKIGAGFAGPVVAQGKAIVFHRLGDQETIDCFDAASGREVWRAEYPTHYRDEFGFDPGPRGTPAIAGDRVYTYGAEGSLHCWNLVNGKEVWGVATPAKFHQRKGFFGMACSPLVEGDLVIVNVGGRDGAGLVAFDKNTGEVRWKVTDDEASYASPVAATIGGKRRIFALTREAFVAVNTTDGALLFRHPWRPATDASVSAASPLIVEDTAFLSASYDVGGGLWRIRESGVEKIWEKDDALANHYATSVHRDGFLFGFDGRQEQGCDLRCVELRTGKVRWSERGLGAGTVTVANDRLLVLTDNGELLMAAAAPTGFKTTGRAQILPSGVRAHPALAAGRFYARSKDRLVCVDLSSPAPSKKP